MMGKRQTGKQGEGILSDPNKDVMNWREANF
jgi:hypothetical protein